MLEKCGQSSIPSGTLSCWHSERPPKSPWTQRQIGDVVWTEKQDHCHPLGSVGPGKAALMGNHELPNHTIWFTFFPSSKINNPFLFTLSWLALVLVILDCSLLILALFNDPGEPGNLLYSHCLLMSFFQEEFPVHPFPCVWYLAVTSVVLLVQPQVGVDQPLLPFHSSQHPAVSLFAVLLLYCCGIREKGEGVLTAAFCCWEGNLWEVHSERRMGNSQESHQRKWWLKIGRKVF